MSRNKNEHDPEMPKRNLITRIADGYANWQTKSPIKDVDGSFIQSSSGSWEVWFRVDPDTAFDHRSMQHKMDVFLQHLQLVPALTGYTCHIEVLPVPVSFDERCARLRQYELAPDFGDDESAADDWELRREARVHADANWLRQNYGDYESRCYLGVKLNPVSISISDVPNGDFMNLPAAERFYIEDPKNFGLIKPAQKILYELRAAWPKIHPLSRQQADLMLGLTNWPGHADILPPYRAYGVVNQDKNKAVTYYGQCSYKQAAPGVLQFDYNGQSSYVSVVTISQMPDSSQYHPNLENELGWRSTLNGRRIRFSYRFRVLGSAAVRSDADGLAARSGAHSDYVAKYNGNGRDLDVVKGVASAYKSYAYETENNQILVGTMSYFVTADSLEEAQNEAAILQGKVRLAADLVVDSRLQAKLYEYYRPGAPNSLNRYVLRLSPAAFAGTMPFVTSGISSYGPDIIGMVRGRENVIFTGHIDMARRPNINRASLWALFGDSGGGKTTLLVDLVIAMIMRKRCPGFIYELTKDDILKEILGNRKIPGLIVRYYDIVKYPGLLNPAGMATDPKLRVDMSTQFLIRCMGTKWRDEWEPNLRTAVDALITNTDKKATNAKPDFRVLPRYLSANRYVYGQSIVTLLEPILNDPVVGPLFFADNDNHDTLAEMATFGLSVIMQQGFDIPDAKTAESAYTPQNWLALAGLEQVSELGYALIYNREIEFVAATVEFNKTAELTKGASEAVAIARIVRSLHSTVLWDTQATTDFPPKLMNQINGKVGFQMESRSEAEAVLEQLGMEVSDRKIAQQMQLARDPSDVDSDAAKGTAFIRLPTGEVFCMQGLRRYVGAGVKALANR